MNRFPTNTPFLLFALWTALCLPSTAMAASPAAALQARYEAQAARENPAFRGASAERGRRFFRTTHGNDWSCASCHTPDPTATGKHAVTGRALRPLAPSANPARFADAAKTEKWFRRNCRDVLDRECSAAEKADVIAWLASARPGDAR